MRLTKETVCFFYFLQFLSISSQNHERVLTNLKQFSKYYFRKWKRGRGPTKICFFQFFHVLEMKRNQENGNNAEKIWINNFDWTAKKKTVFPYKCCINLEQHRTIFKTTISQRERREELMTFFSNFFMN